MADRLESGFRFNVRDIYGRPGQMRESKVSAQLSARWGEGIVFVAEGADVVLDARFESVHEGILATAEAAASAVGECGRCLDPIALKLRVEFQELFAYHQSEDIEYEVFDNYVDLEPLVRDAIVLALPFQPVCRPDCAGLDPKTGLRYEISSVPEREDQIDHRWAALAGFGEPDEASSAK